MTEENECKEVKKNEDRGHTRKDNNKKIGRRRQ